MSVSTLTVCDETATGEKINKVKLSFNKTIVTVKDIISSRVEMEVKKYNSKLSDRFHGLIRPTDAEETLNGYKMKKKKTIDSEKQIYIALFEFQKNSYFVFVDDMQVDNLDTKVILSETTNVSFLKLTPLVGG